MQLWGRRIPSFIGTALLWAATWSAAGIVLARVPGFHSDLPFAILFAPLGFLAGLLYIGIFRRVEDGREGGPSAFLHAAMRGAASGLLLSAVIVAAAALRGDDWWKELLLFGPPLAVGSAISAAGSLALSRRAHRRQLAAATETGDAALSDETDSGPRQR